MEATGPPAWPKRHPRVDIDWNKHPKAIASLDANASAASGSSLAMKEPKKEPNATTSNVPVNRDKED
eukprot:6198638-Pleurochrysis_carterae.AAC.1